MTIEIQPYEAVGGLRFGQMEAEARALFGPPAEVRHSRLGALELHYPLFIVRFDATSGGFNEFTALPACDIVLHGRPVVWQGTQFLQELAETDDELFDISGFIVSFENGVGASGFHDGDEPGKAVHAFARGLWDIEPGDPAIRFLPPP